MKDFNKALSYSFLLLKYRARSRDEINSRLKQKEYGLSVRKQVLNYLEENNYINDEDFVRIFSVCSIEKGWGPRRIDFNLKKLGIPSSLRKQALAQNKIDTDRIREIIERKIGHYKSKRPIIPPNKIWQKIVAHLVAKGFEYNDIFRELQRLGVNQFENR